MVFDSISWGELFVVSAVGATLIGRKDLPNACRYAGSQIGRVVGLLQGARARADQFANNNELKQLQNELRSGLRELDQVKSELAVAASTQGMVGRTLGATTGIANRIKTPSAATASINTTTQSASISPTTLATTNPNTTNVATIASSPLSMASSPVQSVSLPPAYQTERAVMEEEWEKRGIGFKSVAEQGVWMGGSSDPTATSNNGSELLANLIKENLIFDQYDRVVGEQEAKLEERIDQARQRRNKNTTSDDGDKRKDI